MRPYQVLCQIDAWYIYKYIYIFTEAIDDVHSFVKTYNRVRCFDCPRVLSAMVMYFDERERKPKKPWGRGEMMKYQWMDETNIP